LKNTIEHIDELIGKYLAGEASAAERAEVERWAKQNAANEKYLAHCKIIFEKTSNVKAFHRFDEDAAWNKVKAKLTKDAKVVSLDNNKSNKNFYYRVAASIIIVLGIGFFMLREFSKSQEVEMVAETAPLNNVLPDGSNVFLNKKTKLSYVFDKKKKSHVVKLKGEAYFKIKHEEKKNLIVEADGVFIHDIGTAFNVKAYPETNTIEVVVEEGEVEFYTSDNVGLHLGASAKGVYDKTTKQFSLAKPESNVLSYKTKVFSFDGTSLGEVVNELNEVYEKKIVLADHLKNCRLTVYFNNEDIDEIVSVIAETLNLSVTKTDKEILLEGTACE
jgi:ferric-dicitrate binding protein FerR (iron transport regulator)